MRRHLRPGDARTAAPLALSFLVPLLPLSHARQRRQRGDVAVPLLVAGEKRRGASVDIELHADDRPHGTLADVAGLIRVRRRVGALQILEWRHGFDAELGQRAEIRGVGDAEMAEAELTRASRQGLRGNGAVGEGEAGVGAELDVHSFYSNT